MILANDLEKRITAKMVLDSTGFNESLQGVNQGLKVAQSELKNASAQVGAFGKNTESLKNVQQALAQQIELQAKKVDIYRQSIEKVTEKMNANITERDKVSAALEREKAKLEGSIQAYGKESQVTQNAKEKVAELTKEYEEKEKSVQSNAKQLQNYTVNMNKADAELTKMRGELNKTNSELDKSNNKWIQASTVLKESSEKLKGFGETTGKIGDGLLKISAPIVAAGAASSKFAIDFEDGMAKVSTVADTSKTSLEELGDGVINLSNMAGEGFETIQGGLYDTISSGVKAEDSVNFLTTAVKAAKGGFTDTATSVDGLTSTLNAYGLEASKANDIANQMFIAQNLGKTTFGEMSASIGNVIPISAALGVKTDELFSSLAVLTANGIKTSESVTGMKAAMSNIIKPSKEAADAADALGIKFDAATVKSRGWIGFLGDIKKKLQDVAPEYAKSAEQYDKTVIKMGKLEKAGQKNSEMYKALKKSLKGQKEELDVLEKSNSSQLSAFAQLFGSVEGLNSVLTLTSDQGMSLYNESMQQMGTNTTALDDAFNKVNDTTGSKLKRSLNELKNNSIKLGEAAMPLIEEGSNLIGMLTDKLSSMDAKQLKTILDIGLFTAGLGGVLKVGGGVASSIGSIVDVAGKLSGALGTAKVAAEGAGTAAEIAAGIGGAGGMAGLGTALGSAALAAAPWIAAGAAVAGTGYVIYKGMTQEAVPAVDLFADKVNVTQKNVGASYGNMVTQIETDTTKISNSTKQAVGAYIKLDDDAKKSLTDLYVNGTVLTNQTVNTLVQKYSDMATQIKTGMDKHYNDEFSAMQQFFQKSNALSIAEESNALSSLQLNNLSKKTEIDNYEKQIQLILQNASNNHRALSLDEQQKINSIQEKMKTNAVKSLSDTEIESKVILERLKEYGTRITAEQASSEIQNANKARDEGVKAANDQYTKTVENIIKMRDETHSLTADQADKLIKDAQRQRDDSIKHAEELRDGVVKKITSMDSDISNDVDTTTGKILTWWDKVKSWWNSWFPAKKTMQVDSNYSSYLTGNTSSNGSSSYPAIGHNARGTNSWNGGLTYKDENGYEIYDLPRGTRIYNHDASEDMAKKTAEEVARNVLSNIDTGSSGNEIIIPIYLDGKQIANVTSPYLNGIQAKNLRKNFKGVAVT